MIASRCLATGGNPFAALPPDAELDYPSEMSDPQLEKVCLWALRYWARTDMKFAMHHLVRSGSFHCDESHGMDDSYYWSLAVRLFEAILPAGTCTACTPISNAFGIKCNIILRSRLNEIGESRLNELGESLPALERRHGGTTDPEDPELESVPREVPPLPESFLESKLSTSWAIGHHLLELMTGGDVPFKRDL